MLKLEEITKDAQITGLLPDEVVKVVNVEEIGTNARLVAYRNAQGKLDEQTIFRQDEHRLALAVAGRAWAFDADPAGFKLALEAYRISLAHLFDPLMAVHTSNVEPLPHQISAVYQSMLPRQPLRFVLADDPGAGKTVTAGLLIREMTLRARARQGDPTAINPTPEGAAILAALATQFEDNPLPWMIDVVYLIPQDKWPQGLAEKVGALLDQVGMG